MERMSVASPTRSRLQVNSTLTSTNTSLVQLSSRSCVTSSTSGYVTSWRTINMPTIWYPISTAGSLPPARPSFTTPCSIVLSTNWWRKTSINWYWHWSSWGARWSSHHSTRYWYTRRSKRMMRQRASLTLFCIRSRRIHCLRSLTCRRMNIGAYCSSRICITMEGLRNLTTRRYRANGTSLCTSLNLYRRNLVWL